MFIILYGLLAVSAKAGFEFLDRETKMKTEESVKRMYEGRLYQAGDEAILQDQTLCLEAMYDYNATRPSESKRRRELLRKMFCEIGERCYIEPPFYANWGGRHVHFGDDVYANFA